MNRHESGKIKYAPCYLYIYIRVIMASVDTCCTQHLGFFVPSKSEFSAGDDRMRFGTRKEANEPPEKKPKTEKAHLKISEF